MLFLAGNTNKALCSATTLAVLDTLDVITRGGDWSFKNSGSRKILVEFHGSCSLVFLAGMSVSQSRFLYEGVSRVSIFCKAKGPEVPIRLFF